MNKIGRDSVLYVESLIESIMGGLEGLINILDSEGGFGSLEMQLVPDRTALRMSHETKSSNASLKSPKGGLHWPLPGHESYPENSDSVKMLEAAMQRLTSLCSVLNDMEPICVLNHVFVLREYMRDCILENFRRRLLTVLRTDKGLERPSVIESLIQRHISIIRLAEQHISMDLTTGIHEILLTETFTVPAYPLQTFERSSDTTSGSAMEIVCSWYMENIIKDASGAGIIFSPLFNCFKSSRPIGAYFAESFTDSGELKALFRVFGGYGFSKFDRMIRELVAALLNCIDGALRSNREALEAVAGSINSLDRIEREANLRQIVDIETLTGFCIQAGEAIAFHQLLVEAAGAVLEEKAPLIASLVSGMAKQLPDEIPEKDEISRLRIVANSIGVAGEHDIELVRSIMMELGFCGDGSWDFFPYVCAAFMLSPIWNSASFDMNTGGFNVNIQCLGRCVNAVIAGSEFMKTERREKQRQSLSNGHDSYVLEREVLSRKSVEANIKSIMQLYVKCSAGIILDSSNEGTRSHLVPKLIFLDQLCEISPYLPRSTLELHIPYMLIRSIYRQQYGNSSTMSFDLLSQSPRQSPMMSLAHASPALKPNQGNSTPYGGNDPSYFNPAGHKKEHIYDVDGSSYRVDDKQTGNARRSGPLENSLNRKVKFAEGSASSNRGVSPLPRFAVSRSGPMSYK